MEYSLKLIKEYGITAVFAFALVWQNTKINKVEQMLYDCYEARILTSATSDSTVNTGFRLVAVLPNGITIKNGRDKKNV